MRGAISAFDTFDVPQCAQDSSPRFSCVSKAALLANQASNSWPFLHFSR